MNYQVIARRYRPRRFEEVVGQESAAETLRAGILQDRIAHAYLFSGPRGVGKTSMARIFAKAINCSQAADRSRPREDWGMPCDECATCDAIHLGQDIDVVEMDGASHRGIEDVRSIIEGVNRPATRCEYKIYIIDEVHMLTREAFNALLKTLEEPPPHVKFVFATTEAHRIPETVLSRCQRFDFHPISQDAIVKRLGQILGMEGREAEEGLLERVAAYGRGGLRDAQTLLDQLMTFDEGELRVEALDRVTGRVPAKLAGILMEAVLGRNPARALECFRESLTLGADPGMVIEQLVADFRGRVHEIVAVGDEKGARSDASPSSLDRHLGALQILLDTAGKLRHSAYPDVAVEIAILKVTRLEEPADLEEVIRSLREIAASGDAATPGVLRSQGHVGTAPQRRDGAVDRRPTVEELGRQLGEASPPRSERSPDISAAQEPRSEDRRPRAAAASDVEGMRQAAMVGETAVVAVAPDPVEEASSSGAAVQDEPGYDFGALNELWDQIRIELESKHPDIAPFFKEVRPEPAQGVTDTVRLRFPDEFFQRQMKASGRQQVLEDVVRAVTATPWKFLMEHLPPGVEVTSIGGVGPTRLQAPPAPTVEKATSTEQAPPARSSRPQSARAPSSRPQDPRTGGIQARPDSNIAPAVEDGGDASEESRTPGATTPQGGGRPGGDGIAKDPIVLKSIDLFKGRIV